MRNVVGYRRALTILIVLFGMVLPSGCNQHLAGRPKRIQFVEKDPNDLTPFESDLLELEGRYDDPDTSDKVRQNARDTYVRKMIAAMDKRYHDFLDDMIVERKGFDATADIAAIGLDTASVLFTPVTTKSILAGLSGLTTAGKTSITKVYFYEQALPALISQMEADRQAVLADILEGLSGDINVYSLCQAQRDLNRYYTAGTIDGALTEIQKHAAQKSEAAQERIRKDVQDQIQAGRARQTAALGAMKDEASFLKMRTAVENWWAGLNNDTRWEQIDVIVQWAEKHGVSTEPLKVDGKVHPDRFPAMLGSLTYNEANRLFLADIVRNAIGIELPK